MKASSTTLFLFVLLLALNFAEAQQLAPAPVDLAYRFHPGHKLHFHRVFETRNPEKPDGYENDNYDYIEDYYITVTHVEPNGTATLFVGTNDSYDWHHGEDGSIGQSVRRAYDIPFYSVTIDSKGHFIQGTIVRRSPDDSEMMEKMKSPDFRGSKISDSAHLAFSIGNVFEVRPEMKSTTPGSRLRDSIYIPWQSHNFIPGSPTAGTAVPPAPPGYDVYVNEYSLVEGKDERGAERARLIKKSNHKLAGPEFNVISTSDEDQHIRASDGIAVARTELTHKTRNGSPDPVEFKNTITLISDE